MKRRQAFTLVELMVSMALIIFIMAILSQAFIAALSVFRNLKAQGDLAEKLRGTSQILQHDLAAYHFDGTRRLSDSNFWLNGPPSQGFFRIWQGGSGFVEGTDLPGLIGSYISTNHYLAFTVKLNGNDMGDFMSAGPFGGGQALGLMSSFGPNESRYQVTSGLGTYNSQWAEVAWFLQPQINPTTLTPDTTTPDVGVPPVLPLFTLYRRQRLLVPDNSLVIPAQTVAPSATTPLGIGGFQEMSCWVNGANLYFNNPADITVPWRRFGMVAPFTPSYQAGLLYATSSFPPSPWPITPPVTPPPWGTWTPPSPLPPTYPPSPTAPFLPNTPSYPTLVQEPGVPAPLYGSDIQLNDVISFDVRVYAAVPGVPPTPIINAANPQDPFVTLFTVAPLFSSANVNSAFYNAATNPGAPAVFDTWTMLDDGMGTNYQTSWLLGGTLTGIPMWNGTAGPLIKAIQITLRIWDFKTNQTRQVTIVQAM